MRKVRILFSKNDAACYLSHLDVMRTFARSFLRAEIPLRHTEGFNPHPYLSIAHPLPVGFSSDCELLDCEILSDEIEGLQDRLNASLPGGFRVLSAYAPAAPASEIAFAEYELTYRYDGSMPDDAAERLNAFFAAPSIPVVKKGKKGQVEINLAEYYQSISFRKTSAQEICGTVLLLVREAPLNPRYITQAISEETLRPDFSKYRRKAYFNREKNAFR